MLKQFGRFPKTAGFKKVSAAADIFASKVDGIAQFCVSNTPNPSYTVFVGGFIGLIERVTSVAQVIPRVVVAHTVNVVNLVRRVSSLHVQKSKSVGRVTFPIQLNLTVAISNGSCLKSYSNAASGVDVGKDSRSGVITKKVLESSLGYLLHKHSIH